MDTVRIVMLVAAGAAGVYTIYRLARWAEERGYVRWSGSMGGVAGGMAEVQRHLEPQTRHVYQIQDEARRGDADAGPGPV